MNPDQENDDKHDRAQREYQAVDCDSGEPDAGLAVDSRYEGLLYPLGVLVQSGTVSGIVCAADYGSGHGCPLVSNDNGHGRSLRVQTHGIPAE